jgi:hypothetical protein
MTTGKKHQALKRIFWDYNFSEEELLDLLHGRRQSLGSLARSALLTRMFEYMNWFDIVDHIDKDFFLAAITPEFITGCKEKDLQQGLTFVRDFLLREPVSIAK